MPSASVMKICGDPVRSDAKASIEPSGEKQGEARVLRRDFTITPGERVLVVDDVLTTGKSVRETLDAVRALGGDVIGIGVMVDRSETPLDFGAELFSCLRAPAIAYSPDECPFCAAGVSLTKPGGG